MATASSPKIDRGVPLPERAKNKYPVKDMRPGDSFEIPLNGESLFVIRSRINGALPPYRRQGWTFATRKTDTGVRVWRLS